MLVEKIKKAKKDNRTVYQARGGCKFCGQIAEIETLEGWGEENNEIATELCQCEEAKYYARKKGQKERGHRKVDRLFGAENGEIITTQEARELLHKAVDAAVECKVGKVTVELGAGAKGTINLTGKGVLKVKRTITKNSEMEA